MGEQTKGIHGKEDKDIQTLLEFIQRIQFGSVNIIIQDGKIVQIEKSEKIRLR